MATLQRVLDKYASKPYNQKKASRCIILLKKNKNLTHQQQEKLIYELFCITASITLKGVNNFKSLVKDTPKSKIIHEDIDIISECYIGMHRCVLNIKMKDWKKFHFYYNSTLNRIIYRIYERNYKKHQVLLENTESVELKTMNHSRKSDSEFDLMEIDINGIGFTDIEMEIVEMRSQGQDFGALMKRHKMLPSQYKVHIESIKSKLVNFYNLGEKFKS